MPRIGEIKKAEEIGKLWRNKYIWHACIDCGKERWVLLCNGQPRALKCQSCAGKGKRATDETKPKLSLAHRGVKSRSWKGGYLKTKLGYILVRIYEDDFFFPMADKTGYVREHRLVMAKHLNRCLLPWEIVHHKGTKYPLGSIENKSDNRIENLQLLPTGKQHLPSVTLQAELAKRDKRIMQLEARLTLLEAENVLLRSENSVRE